MSDLRMPDSELPPRPVRQMPPPRTAAQTRALPDARPVRPALEDRAPRAPRAKPDPNPLRIMLALAGLASASAITTALLPSILPVPANTSTQSVNDAAVAPQPSVIHITRTVQLSAGQTAPPNTSVVIPAQPTPQVRVQVVTRQSGRP